MLSPIAYHDQLVLLALLDAEWSRSGRGSASYNDVQSRFQALCTRYSTNISDNFGRFKAANGTSGRGADDALQSHFFRPLFYRPFGHADQLAIVLSDDFDPLHFLTAGLKRTFEEVNLAFSPFLVDKASCFTNLADVVMSDPKTRPLLAYTKFKFDGLGTVGPGLQFQAAMLRAVADRIHDTLALLERHVGGPQVLELYNQDDCSNVRCVLLDLQGAEEMGTLIFCRNFTIAASLVAAIRSLTYDDLFCAEKKARVRSGLAAAFNRSEMLSLLMSCTARGDKLASDTLAFNHVFRWTHTTLAAIDAAFETDGEASGAVTGYVESLANVQVAPGHTVEVEAILERHREIGETAARLPSDFHRFQIGVGDLLWPHIPKSQRPRLPLVQAAQVLRQTGANIRAFSDASKRGRHVVDVLTELSIPVPQFVEDGADLIFGGVAREHFALLGQMLPQIRTRLCYPGDLEAEDPPRDDAERAAWNLCLTKGRLDIDKLKLLPRMYGLPVQLRRTIEDLFEYFATLIADPFLFDVVLDLYDSFATLHHMLTDGLPSDCAKREPGSTWPPMHWIDGNRVSQLSWFVATLHEGLVHRMAKAYPESQLRELAIDFRGGLNQLILAADVPLKCGLGLLRRFIAMDEAITAPVGYVAKEPRELVGGLTRISLQPGITAWTLRFNQVSQAARFPRLMFIEADVPRILHVAGYIDFLHEAAHLVLGAMLDRNADLKADVEVDRGQFNSKTAAEVFSWMLPFVFLFGGDQDAFIGHLTVDMLRQEIGRLNGESESRTLHRRATQLGWVLMACVLMPQDEPKRTRWKCNNAPAWSKVEAWFQSKIARIGRYMPPEEPFWRVEGSEGWQYIMGDFERTYERCGRLLVKLWNNVIDLYARYVEEVAPPAWANDFDATVPQMEKWIREAFEKRRPLVRTAFEGAAQGKDGFDALELVCGMLRHYIAGIATVGEQDYSIHLHRNAENGEVDYTQPPRGPWYPFQIDPGAPSLFCCSPVHRRARLGDNIVIMKTLWDIACNLRGRRLGDILRDNWPDVGASMRPSTHTPT